MRDGFGAPSQHCKRRAGANRQPTKTNSWAAAAARAPHLLLCALPPPLQTPWPPRPTRRTTVSAQQAAAGARGRRQTLLRDQLPSAVPAAGQLPTILSPHSPGAEGYSSWPLTIKEVGSACRASVHGGSVRSSTQVPSAHTSASPCNAPPAFDNRSCCRTRPAPPMTPSST